MVNRVDRVVDRWSASSRPALGPAPASTPVATPAQADILEHLARLGGQGTAAEVAGAAGQHANTVREHLDALVQLGFVHRSARRAGGRGRPAHVYALSSSGGWAGAAEALVAALAGRFAQDTAHPFEAATALGRAYAAELTTPVDAGAGALSGAVRQVLDVTARLGFSPEPSPDPHAIRLRTCPLLPSALRHTDVVCGFHRGLAQGLAGTVGLAADHVHLRPFAEPGACVLELAPDESARSPTPDSRPTTDTLPTAPSDPSH